MAAQQRRLEVAPPAVLQDEGLDVASDLAHVLADPAEIVPASLPVDEKKIAAGRAPFRYGREGLGELRGVKLRQVVTSRMRTSR